MEENQVFPEIHGIKFHAVNKLRWWEKVVFWFCKTQTTVDWGFEPQHAIVWKYSKWLNKMLVCDEFVVAGKRGDQITGWYELPKLND